MRTPHFARALTLLMALATTAAVQAGELTAEAVWQTDFDQALAEAKSLHRPLVVHFHTKWCGPCRKMEKEVLHTPKVLKLLDESFVAVKVDLEKAGNGRLQARYRVESMPTDLILSADGSILARSEGYRGVQSGDDQRYLASLSKIDAKYASEGGRLARSGSSRGEKSGEAEPNGSRAVAQTDPAPGQKLVPEPIEPELVGDIAANPSEGPIEQTTIPARPAAEQVALDGYCPVTLRTTRAWKAGDRRFAVEHDGQTFLFLAAEKRDEFKRDPARFAPRLLGCDPVLLVESDLAIRGSTKFGAYYEGELYLFESAANRAQFRKNPARYTRLKHVLKPEDVKTVRKLASSSGQ